MSTTRHIVGFLVSGMLATTTDAAVYSGLLATGWGHDAGKATSFLAGTVVSFALNRRYTFRSTGAVHREALAFFGLYAVTFLLNVGVNHLAVWWLVPKLAARGEVLGFLAATAASTVANFIGQRWWVFTPSQPPP